MRTLSRTRSTLSLLTIALASHAGHAAAQPATRTAATTRRYRIDAKIQQVVDARAVKGDREQSLTERAVWLRVTLADSAGGTSLHVVIDSIVNRSQPAPPGNAATADSARGKQFAGFLAADGSVTRLSYPAGLGALGTTVGAQLEDFLPRVKAGFKNGDDWTITSTRPQKVPNGELMVKRKTAYAAMGDLVRDGQPASRLDMTFTTNATGSQRIGAAKAKVEGTSMGSGSVFVSKSGVYLGGMRTEKSERRVQLVGAPIPITVAAEVVTTITLLK